MIDKVQLIQEITIGPIFFKNFQEGGGEIPKK